MTLDCRSGDRLCRGRQRLFRVLRNPCRWGKASCHASPEQDQQRTSGNPAARSGGLKIRLNLAQHNGLYRIDRETPDQWPAKRSDGIDGWRIGPFRCQTLVCCAREPRIRGQLLAVPDLSIDGRAMSRVLASPGDRASLSGDGSRSKAIVRTAGCEGLLRRSGSTWNDTPREFPACARIAVSE